MSDRRWLSTAVATVAFLALAACSADSPTPSPEPTNQSTNPPIPQFEDYQMHYSNKCEAGGAATPDTTVEVHGYDVVVVAGEELAEFNLATLRRLQETADQYPKYSTVELNAEGTELVSLTTFDKESNAINCYEIQEIEVLERKTALTRFSTYELTYTFCSYDPTLSTTIRVEDGGEPALVNGYEPPEGLGSLAAWEQQVISAPEGSGEYELRDIDETPYAPAAIFTDPDPDRIGDELCVSITAFSPR